MESYNWNLKSHFKNLELVTNCTTKIAILEIILRNMLDNVLKEREIKKGLLSIPLEKKRCKIISLRSMIFITKKPLYAMVEKRISQILLKWILFWAC
ncbi:hypothetical protein [Helicobacter sp.]|uniref:hypothetical protein n=1 Tax=Helicobacter sp. TaxID=218 RepID=UPI0025BE23A3|nr:hypothetical protein [Helicobacter sp.]